MTSDPGALADGDRHLADRARLGSQRPAAPPWAARADFLISPTGDVVPAEPVFYESGDPSMSTTAPTPLTVHRPAPLTAAGPASSGCCSNGKPVKRYRITRTTGGQTHVLGDRFTVDKPGVLQVFRGAERDPVAVFAIGQWISIEVALVNVEESIAEALRDWAQADPEGDWDGAPEVGRFAAELAEAVVEEVL